MIGPMMGAMLDAADAEQEVKLRDRFFGGVAEPTAEQVKAAMPAILAEIWREYASELPPQEDIRLLCEEHGQDAGLEIVKERFLAFVRAKVGAPA